MKQPSKSKSLALNVKSTYLSRLIIIFSVLTQHLANNIVIQHCFNSIFQLFRSNNY